MSLHDKTLRNKYSLHFVDAVCPVFRTNGIRKINFAIPGLTLKKEGAYIEQVYYKPFRTYCQQVLAHEWFASWNDMSLNAGAYCVKTFSWYYCHYTHASDGSYDVNSAQQS